jgi:hypothetical protein
MVYPSKVAFQIEPHSPWSVKRWKLAATDVSELCLWSTVDVLIRISTVRPRQVDNEYLFEGYIQHCFTWLDF